MSRRSRSRRVRRVGLLASVVLLAASTLHPGPVRAVDSAAGGLRRRCRLVRRPGGVPRRRRPLHRLARWPDRPPPRRRRRHPRPAGRIYYTIEGDPTLYYRYFTPESGVVGGQPFFVSGRRDGLDWTDTRGLAFADGDLYFVRRDGALHRVALVDGDPVPSTDTLVR